jgi:hypothetical protein
MMGARNMSPFQLDEFSSMKRANTICDGELWGYDRPEFAVETFIGKAAEWRSAFVFSERFRFYGSIAFAIPIGGSLFLQPNPADWQNPTRQD